MGLAASHAGDLAAARAHLEQGIALYASNPPQDRGPTVGEDPGITWCVHMAVVLWLLGSPAQAVQQAQQVHRLAERLGHPFSLAHTLNHMARLHLLRGDWGQRRNARRPSVPWPRLKAFGRYKAMPC
jgi:Tetratricopeptide repeat